jgi:hypothetical protein
VLVATVREEEMIDETVSFEGPEEDEIVVKRKQEQEED